MAFRLFAMGFLFPFSKSFTVLSPTLARLAKSCWDQPSQPRAARLVRATFTYLGHENYFCQGHTF